MANKDSGFVNILMMESGEAFSAPYLYFIWFKDHTG
jgi:hypothetical protein